MRSHSPRGKRTPLAPRRLANASVGAATPSKMSALSASKKKKKVAQPLMATASGAPRMVEIADRADPEHSLRAHYYAAAGGKAHGLAVLAPGSRGGMGPGQDTSTLGMFHPRINSIYTEVARKLSTQDIATVHFTWRLNATRKGAPPGTLKSPSQLLLGVADVALAARYVRAQQGKKRGRALPLVVVGFSFGGPSVMAAGALAVSADGDDAPGVADVSGLCPLAGVVTLGCGMRVGTESSEAFRAIGLRMVGSSRSCPHDYGGVDSEGCVDAFAAAGLPLAMIHGLADVTVDPMASQTIFERARGPKTALWLHGADHHMRARFDVVCTTLLQWLPALLSHTPCAPSRRPSCTAPGSAISADREGGTSSCPSSGVTVRSGGAEDARSPEPTHTSALGCANLADRGRPRDLEADANVDAADASNQYSNHTCEGAAQEETAPERWEWQVRATAAAQPAIQPTDSDDAGERSLSSSGSDVGPHCDAYGETSSSCPSTARTALPEEVGASQPPRAAQCIGGEGEGALLSKLSVGDGEAARCMLQANQAVGCPSFRILDGEARTA